MTPAETKAFLRSRCTRCGKCLLWDKAVDDAGVPITRLPKSRKVYQARRVLMEAMGHDLTGKIATTSCGDSRCMEEKHAVAWTRQQLQARSGLKFKGNLARGAMLAAHRRKTARLTLETVRAARLSGVSATVFAEREGVALSTAAKALRGESWREYGSAFGGVGAMGVSA